MIKRFNHIHLICQDLEQMIRFFTTTLGGNFLGRMKFGPADGAQVELGGATINLRVRREDEQIPEPPPGSRYGYDHIGLEVDDLDRAWETLRNRGVEFTVAPRDAEKYRIAFFKGPEQITIELQEPLKRQPARG